MSARTSPSYIGQAIMTGMFIWLAYKSGPVMVGNDIQALPALAYGIAGISTLHLMRYSLVILTGILDWLMTHQPTGKEGTAQWANYKEIKNEISLDQSAPFWGLFIGKKNRPVFIDYASNAMTIAPAGSGKGISTVIPNGFAITDSKVFSDFKGELACILKGPLEARGEVVRILNPGGLWKDILGEGDSYNPLDIIADDLNRAGGLRDVPDDLREMTAQILPEPGDTEGENTYFREGSRRLLAVVVLLIVMLDGYDGTLSAVALLIEDRTALENLLRKIVGINDDGEQLDDGPLKLDELTWAHNHDPQDLAEFISLVRSWATNIISLMNSGDGRTFDSFISGAQQAIAPFAFGRIAPAMRRSTFSLDDLKRRDKITTLFIVADASRMEAYKPFIGFIQWCVMTAIKRHQDKSCPVYFILDEATNYKIHSLDSLLTWGRSYGLRLHLIFQDLNAFEKTYGRTAMETLLSETEIKQFLPGQRSPKTLEMVSKALGSQSLMSPSLSKQDGGLKEQLSEAGRTLMTPDEIRRTDHGILLVRKLPPILIDPISYGEIHPWREQAGINPFHGNPFLKKTRLKLKHKAEDKG